MDQIYNQVFTQLVGSYKFTICTEIATNDEYIEMVSIIRYKFKLDNITKSKDINKCQAKMSFNSRGLSRI